MYVSINDAGMPGFAQAGMKLSRRKHRCKNQLRSFSMHFLFFRTGRFRAFRSNVRPPGDQSSLSGFGQTAGVSARARFSQSGHEAARVKWRIHNQLCLFVTDFGLFKAGVLGGTGWWPAPM